MTYLKQQNQIWKLECVCDFCLINKQLILGSASAKYRSRAGADWSSLQFITSIELQKKPDFDPIEIEAPLEISSPNSSPAPIRYCTGADRERSADLNAALGSEKVAVVNEQ